MRGGLSRLPPPLPPPLEPPVGSSACLIVGAASLAQGDLVISMWISSSVHVDGSLAFQNSVAANSRDALASVTPDPSAPIRKRRRPNSPARESKLRRKAIRIC